MASSYAVWLETTGTIRHAFSGASSGLIQAVVQQPSDNRVLVGGLFASFAGNAGYQNVVRINTDGTLDTTFNPGPNGQVNVIVVQPNGQILIGGGFTSIETAAGVTVPIAYLARLNSDGSVDTSFNPSPNAQVNSLAILSGGTILVGGGFSAMETASSTTLVQRNDIAEINSDGTINANFNPDLNGIPYAIDPALERADPDRRLVLNHHAERDGDGDHGGGPGQAQFRRDGGHDVRPLS